MKASCYYCIPTVTSLTLYFVPKFILVSSSLCLTKRPRDAIIVGYVKDKEVFVMDLSNIVGNDSLKKLISSHIRNHTLSHAYIIEGPQGSGKRTIAREICKALCCTSPDPSLPCGECRSCRRIDEGYNTDIYTLNRGDKATIQVEQIREMTATLGYYPDDGDCKIYVIEEAEKMTTQAQNALLLSLEEPPSYVVFLLLTSDAAALLETVRSRAQVLKTQLFPAPFVIQWLKETKAGKRADEEALANAASVSRGALGAALSALNSKGSKSSAIAADAKRLVELLCADSKAEAVVFASAMKYTRLEFESFFDYAIFAVRDLMAAKVNSDTTTFYPDSEAAKAISSRTRIAKLMRIYNALLCAKDDITVGNAHIYAVMTTLAASV